ncbi:MAG: putative toxin-antitoxin system toxin component, PIN family [Nanoarchaeota archaeon]
MRAVLDTNIFISGIFWDGLPGKILTAAQNGEFELVTSLDCIYELHRVLIEFKDKICLDLVEFWTRFAISNSLVVLPQAHFLEVKDDLDDNKFLDAAVAGKAQFIISGDRHLLNLKEFRGVKIVRPTEFIKVLSGMK